MYMGKYYLKMNKIFFLGSQVEMMANLSRLLLSDNRLWPLAWPLSDVLYVNRFSFCTKGIRP